MDERQLICLMAAIIYAGGVAQPLIQTMTPDEAVEAARTIVESESRGTAQALMKERRSSWPIPAESEGS